eukprot:s3512_g4.t1
MILVILERVTTAMRKPLVSGSPAGLGPDRARAERPVEAPALPPSEVVKAYSSSSPRLWKIPLKLSSSSSPRLWLEDPIETGTWGTF